jgi:hypothetical protein
MKIVGPDRKWEWAALRYAGGDFNTANYADLHARDTWFYQAIGASPAIFGPKAPAGHEGEWIKTIPGKGWFVYFRIYGPEKPAFDGSWRPGDFEVVH